jgi:hypothetical protein
VPGPGVFKHRRGHYSDGRDVSSAMALNPPQSPVIHGNPRASERIKALVPENGADSRRFRPSP